MKRRRLAWLSLPAALSLVAVACSSSSSINISGSSTVEPITAIAAEDYHETENREAVVVVDGPGTGDGFELFCDGAIDISDASRPISEEEIATCERNGIEWIELEVGIDGIAVVTNPNNDLDSLSFADLYALIGPESNGFGTWSDAQPLADELGSTTELPDRSLDLTGPGPESGTYDALVEIALEDIAEERGQEATTRIDYAAASDDNVIIDNVAASDTPLGWVGFAFARDNDRVKTLAISEEPGGEAVAPTDETIADGSYPLARPLFIYVNKAKAEEKETLRELVDFYLDNLDDVVPEAGYIPLPEDRAAETRAAWENR